ncbi:electron transfer flavoprotein subunit beta/FixA family protein [Pseudonocardia sp. C8]|uniref:electron transfer flavoprotein subunit beta/FixA family protein n=1 Tax=Pseudonocardia sp. C8 TaxID=2762759 RepID=UPI00164281C6|nr:electron transfer flavoprotein subunit beta/FixA family protein [Pseudonocardia sp. C8]MBC3193550.1 electron transfer flavoprotein subunit beta/FixA family protein [Pseudonocardia sp. C8]
MKIVALVKQVADTYSERKLSGTDHTLDREGTEAVIDEINERAVEQALQLKEAAGEGEVVVVCMGPDGASDAIRKALSMGADSAVHLSDEAIHGSDAVQTARALAALIGRVEGWDLVIAGNSASDGQVAAVPAMIADLLGVPALTWANELSVEGSTVSVKRETDDGVTRLSAELPAVVSVGEKSTEPRYPSFKGIMAAKKKPVEKLDLAGAGIESSQVGLANALVTVTSSAPKPPKQAGEKVTDEGDGGAKIAEYLVGQKLI